MYEQFRLTLNTANLCTSSVLQLKLKLNSESEAEA